MVGSACLVQSESRGLNWGLEMSTVDDVRFLFSDAGFVSGTEFYVRADAAAAYVDECARRGLVVLGLEAFDRQEGRLKPRLDLIADFSNLVDSKKAWSEAVATSHAEALQFLKDAVGEDSGLVVNVVAADTGSALA